MLQAIAMLQSEHPTAVPTFWQWWQTVMRCSSSSAERGVYSDQLHLEQDICSEHCQKSSAVLMSAEDNLCHSTSVKDRPQYLCCHERKFGVRVWIHKKKKKVCRWHFSLTPSKYVWVDKTQSIFNKLHHARSYELKKQQVGYKIYFRGTLRIFVAF